MMTTETEKSPREIEASKVQCADCFAWIRRDESHTCKQQIRRNQRSAKEQRRAR
jgi:hypothetical protein